MDFNKFEGMFYEHAQLCLIYNDITKTVAYVRGFCHFFCGLPFKLTKFRNSETKKTKANTRSPIRCDMPENFSENRSDYVQSVAFTGFGGNAISLTMPY